MIDAELRQCELSVNVDIASPKVLMVNVAFRVPRHMRDGLIVVRMTMPAGETLVQSEGVYLTEVMQSRSLTFQVPQSGAYTIVVLLSEGSTLEVLAVRELCVTAGFKD